MEGKNMKTSVGMKVIGSFAAIFLLFAAAVAVAQLSIASVKGSADTIARYSGEIETVATMQSYLDRIAGRIYVYRETGGLSIQDRRAALADASSFAGRLNALKMSSFLKSDEKSLLRNITAAYLGLAGSLRGVLAEHAAGSGSSNAPVMRILSAAGKIDGLLQRYRAIDREEIGDAQVTAVNEQKKAEFLLTLLSAVGLAVSGLLAYLLRRNITRPIGVLTRGVEDLGCENLDVHLPVDTGDEIGNLARSFNGMVDRLQEAHRDLESAYFGILEGLAAAIDARDHYTCDHSRRVACYTRVLAGAFALTPAQGETIHRACILHDIGKIGLRDEVLRKPGPLDAAEWEEVTKHPVRGSAMLESVVFLADARAIILHHHERYDGTGYPDGLRAEAIPLGSRILAVADTFDALTSFRPYRERTDPEAAMREIEAHSGTQFDPRVVDALRAAAAELNRVYLDVSC